MTRPLPPVLRVIVDGRHSPPRNMARDAALLVGDGPPTLRLYGWSPPGLSIGYFQRAAAFARVAGDHVLVRRQTGGGAIYHGEEVTFALACDAVLLPGAVSDSYVRLHAAIARALARVGVTTQAVPPGAAPATRARPADAWCFARPGPHDLVAASGGKLVGSAQRRIHTPARRVLHHGSIPLSPPAQPPGCAAVSETVDPDGLEAELVHALTEEIAGELALRAVAGTMSTAELATATRLEQERYADTCYTYGR